MVDKHSPEPVVDNDSIFVGLFTRVCPFPLLPLRVLKASYCVVSVIERFKPGGLIKRGIL